MTRSRSRNVTLSFPGTRRYINSAGVVTSSVGTSYNQSKPETMGDTKSPGYFAKQRRGQLLPVNPMTHSKFSVSILENTTSRWTRKGKYSPYTNNGTAEFIGSLAQAYMWGKSYDWPAWVGTTPTWVSDTQVLTDALANARSHGFDMLTFAVEWNKTAELLKGFNKRFGRRVDTILDDTRKRVARRSRGTTADEVVKVFTDTWLEYRYGWRTLAYDIEGLYEAWMAFNATTSNLVRGYSTGRDSKTRTLVTQSIVQSTNLRVTPTDAGMNAPIGSAWVKQDLVYEKRAGCLLEAAVRDFISVDPLVTSWEVIPYSFIVDWFFNVGSTIQAFSPFAKEALQDAWISKRTSLKTYAMATPATGDVYTGIDEVWTKTAGGVNTVEKTETSYERYKASPTMDLQWRMNIDIPKVTDVVAILIGRHLSTLRELRKLSRM